jgi:curved DNA-binding protein CbpA
MPPIMASSGTWASMLTTESSADSAATTMASSRASTLAAVAGWSFSPASHTTAPTAVTQAPKARATSNTCIFRLIFVLLCQGQAPNTHPRNAYSETYVPSNPSQARWWIKLTRTTRSKWDILGSRPQGWTSSYDEKGHGVTTPDRGPFPAIHPVEAMAMPIAGRRSGILTLRSGPKWHDIGYVNGKAIQVESSSVDESMPMLMADSGALPRQTAIELINRMRESHSDPFEDLLSRGVITDDKLRELTRWRALMLIRRAAEFREGSFSFRELSEPRLPGPALDLKLPAVLLATLIKQDEHADLQQRLNPWLASSPRLTSNPATGPAEFGFRASDAELLRLFDGKRTVRDVLGATSMAPTHAIPTVWLMLVSGAMASPRDLSDAAAQPQGSALAVPPGGAPEDLTTTLEVPAISPPKSKHADVDVATGRATALGQTLFGDEFLLDDGARDAISAAADAFNPAEETADISLDEFDDDEASLNTDERTRFTELAETLRRMETGNYLDVLGLTPDCNSSDVRQAFHALARQYHPDHVTGEHGQIRRQIQSIFARISEAHETLDNDKRRKAYIDKVIHGKKDAQELAMEQARRLMEAEAAYKMGVRLLTAGQTKSAHEKFKAAINGDTEELEYHCYHLYTSFLLAFSHDPDRAERAVDRLTELSYKSRNPTHFHLLAKAVLRQGNDELAMELLRRVLRRQRGNEEAMREYKLAERRLQKAKDKSTGAFGGLFSRFKK